MNTFNMKQWLTDNKVGPYSKIRLTESEQVNDQWLEQFKEALHDMNVNRSVLDQILMIPSSDIISMYGEANPNQAAKDIIRRMGHSARESKEIVEDDFDLTNNPLKNTNFLQPNQCIEIIMDMSRGFFADEISLANQDADTIVKEDLQKEIATKLEEMYEDVQYYFDEGDEFLPYIYKHLDEEVPQAHKLADKVYFLYTGDESGKFIIGNNKEVIKDLTNYVVFDDGKYEISDSDGLDEYLDSLAEKEGEWLDTVEDGYFLKKATEYRNKLEKGVK